MRRVVPLTAALEPAWRDLAVADPRHLIYGSLEYRDFLAAAIPGSPHYLVALEGDRVQGGMPVFALEVPGLGTILNSLPWYGSHGGCVLAPGAPPGIREILIGAYATLAAAHGVLAATMILSPEEEAALPIYREILAPTALDGRIGQMTALPEQGLGVAERLLATIHQKTRNLVRKSLRQGFERTTADSDAAWAFLHRVHGENMLAIGGRAKPWAHFEALRTQLPPAWREVAVATLDGEPVAALLTLGFNRTVEYFTPVVRREYRSLQPLSYLVWHGMLDAIEQGMRWWNWGGTWVGQSSLHHFKAGWGAEDRPYSYLIQASPQGLETLRRQREVLGGAFPYYYVYPYDRLG